MITGSTVNRQRLASLIAILFHLTGLIGMLWINQPLFARLTPFNLLVMLLLLWWTQERKNAAFYLFFLLCFCVGIGVEIIGVNTHLLFGVYQYGQVMGLKWHGVPLLIGINWFITIYCSGTAMHLLWKKITSNRSPDQTPSFARWQKFSVVFDGALLAVFFDWIMEPVAVSLGFWQWLNEAGIPMLNYISWFVVSVGLLGIFSVLKFQKVNQFAVHLLLIQAMFFLLLRTFLQG